MSSPNAVKRAQERQLRAIVEHAAYTQFGDAHDFVMIRNHADFVERVPIGDYDSFSPAIDKMRDGARDILVPEFVKYYGNSSGSSSQGRGKFLPITERQIRYQRGSGSDVLSRYLAHYDVADITDGFFMGLFPPTKMKPDGPVYITSNPGLMMAKMPLYTRPMYLPSADLRNIGDYNEKLAMIARKYVNHDVRMIGGTTCWFSLLFDNLLEAAREAGHKADTVCELWPNLKVLLGGGVAAGPYIPVIRERLGNDNVVLVDNYNATEGGVFASSDFSGAGMLMIPDRGVFFEFIPIAEIDDDKPTRVPLWRVEKDELYAILVTTPSGLYAYKLGDIVRFPSTDPLRIEFAGRLSGCLSTTQELTTHVEIEMAVQNAIGDVPCKTVDFGCGADVGVDGSAKSRYVLFVEFTDGGRPRDVDAFAQAFDARLCEQNRVYREHRKNDAAILPAEVVVLRSGGVRAYMDQAGNANVQTKFPRIVDDTRKLALRGYR